MILNEAPQDARDRREPRLSLASFARVFVIMIAGLGLMLVGTQGQAEELTSQKRQDIRALLIANNIIQVTRDSFTNSMGQVDIFKGCTECPDNAKDILTRIAGKVIAERAAEPGQLIDQLIPLYADIFTHKEVLSWLTFIRSPVGRKIVANNLVMAPSISAISNEWIKSLTPTINERTRAAFTNARVRR